LSEFGLSREQADAMIMVARVRAGWVDEAAAAPEAGEAADEAPAS
jgi:N utilization substance protein A